MTSEPKKHLGSSQANIVILSLVFDILQSEYVGTIIYIFF